MQGHHPDTSAGAVTRGEQTSSDLDQCRLDIGHLPATVVRTISRHRSDNTDVIRLLSRTSEVGAT
jgi:hypothetical protein